MRVISYYLRGQTGAYAMRAGGFAVLILTLAACDTSLSPPRVRDVFGELWFAVVVAVVAIAALEMWVRWDLRHSHNRTDSQRASRKELEDAAENAPLVKYIDVTLQAAAEVQEEVAEISTTLAVRYARAGFFLMCASVVVPFLLVFLYLNLQPPALPGGGVAQRDWHLLLAGVSFGLLFIAAARGIMAAADRQREVYARELREVTYYGDLRRALGIAHRLDGSGADATQDETKKVARRIMGLLLDGERPSLESLKPAPEQGQEHEYFKIAADLTKPRA